MYIPYALLTVGLRWVIFLGVEVFNVTDDDLTYKFLCKPFDESPVTTVVGHSSAITNIVKNIFTALDKFLALLFPSTSRCFIGLFKKPCARNTSSIGPDQGIQLRKLSSDSSHGDDDKDPQLLLQRQSSIGNSSSVDDHDSQLVSHSFSSISISSSIHDDDENPQLALKQSSMWDLISVDGHDRQLDEQEQSSAGSSSSDDDDHGSQLVSHSFSSISISSSISSINLDNQDSQLDEQQQANIWELVSVDDVQERQLDEHRYASIWDSSSDDDDKEMQRRSDQGK